jgi:DNA repair exonuclease SbcCD nuclease subunit
MKATPQRSRATPQRFRFVHAADLHLDTPFEGLRDVAPEVGRALREASLDAFDALVELCVEREAAFLLIAGDVYDGAERGLRAQLRFRQGLERLSDAGIQVLVVHGNHDPSEEGWSALREWPEGTRVFGSDRVEQAVVERDGARLATVFGISYPRRDVHENLSLAFPRSSGKGATEATGLRIGLLHCNAGGSADHAPYAACSVSDLASADLDYWALGHVHGRRTLGESPWIVYPGNLQGRSPRPTEQGPKGAVLVEVDLAPVPRVVDVSFEALDRVRFWTVELDVSGSVDLAEVERGLQERADELRDANPGRGLVLSARLVGSSDVQRDLARKNSPSELLDSLRDARRDGDPFVWWASLASDVTRPIDREGLRERDDFCAEILNLADELAASPEALQRFRRDALGELPEKLQTVVLPESAEPDPVALLRRAEREALARVVNEESGGAS